MSGYTDSPRLHIGDLDDRSFLEELLLTERPMSNSPSLGQSIAFEFVDFSEDTNKLDCRSHNR